ncbi:MAG: hypothetical protein FWD33_03120 [Alphaproteobacteria bacterium]|nr:hypothetical protein [Alphaproteobacteria bacterium]
MSSASDAIFKQAYDYHTMTPDQQRAASLARKLDEIQAIDEGRARILSPGEAREAMAAAAEGIQAAKRNSSGRTKYFFFPNNPLAKSLVYDTNFNPARNGAFCALIDTFLVTEGRPVTEVEFRDLWLQKIFSRGLIAEGWYSPPPFGAAVLFGRNDDPARISYTRLRYEEFWPRSENVVDWKSGFMYAYCSPVHKETGIIGDMSVCLYFGEDERLRAHFINAYRATAELLEQLPKVSNSKELFEKSNSVFQKYNLANNIDSMNDPLNNNVGHTFPSIGKIDADSLTDEQKDQLSGARIFINGGEPLEFTDGMQFTIEPQLVSTLDSSLPKVTFHYVAKKVPEGYRLCNIINILSAKYRLI